MPKVESAPESDPAKRFWIRRRIVLGAVGLMVVLAVSRFVFGVFDHKPVAQLSATFLRFEKSVGGTSTVALIVLTNLSPDTRYQSFLNSSGLMPNWLPRGSHFRSDSSNGVSLWDPYRPATGFALTISPAPLVVTNEFELPADGRRGRIVVQYFVKEPPAPAWLQGMGKAFGLQPGTTYNGRLLECDEEIQCPLVRADGTVEPARLLPKAERQGP